MGCRVGEAGGDTRGCEIETACMVRVRRRLQLLLRLLLSGAHGLTDDCGLDLAHRRVVVVRELGRRAKLLA